MSTKNLVNAIIVGDALEIEKSFQSTIAEKISARLDDFRQEVAQRMFATEAATPGDAKQHYMSGYDAHGKGKTRQHNPYKEGSQASSMWAKGWEHASDKKQPVKFANEEVELDEEQLDEGHSVVWTDRNYKENTKHFKLGKLDSPDASARKAHEFAKKLEKNPDIRSVRVKPMSESVELEEQQLDEIDKLAMRGMFSADPKSKQHIGVTTEKGKAARAKANLPVLKQVISRSLGKHPKPNLPEEVEQLYVTTVESALYAMEDGRSILDEQLDEAVSSDSKNRYEFSNGKKPSGRGNWMFSTVHPREHDFKKHGDQTVSVQGTFGDAAKKAASHFKEKGHKGDIHVLP